MEPPSYEESLQHSPYQYGAPPVQPYNPPPTSVAQPEASFHPPQQVPPYPQANFRSPNTPDPQAEGELSSWTVIPRVPPNPYLSTPYNAQYPPHPPAPPSNSAPSAMGAFAGSPMYPSSQPSAPPLGAEGVQSKPQNVNPAHAVQPPTGADVFYIPPFNRTLLADVISEDMILSSFEALANKKSWFFNRPKNPRQFVSIKGFSTSCKLRYKLSSYVEKRCLKTRTEKIYGHGKHLANTEPIRNLWHYDLTPASEWWTGSRERVVQNTVEKCDECHGLMRSKCTNCDTMGKVRCPFMHPEGGTTCINCSGHQFVNCTHCQGFGSIKCPKCDGNGALRFVHSVEAKFETIDGFFFDGDHVEVPEKKLQGVKEGFLLFSDERFPPIPSLPPYQGGPQVNEGAMRLLKSHYETYVSQSATSTRVLKQRHSLMVIPVTTVDLTYKGKPYKLWIYGKERAIHCPSMNSCSIL